ncbi:hypothetical protein HMPREF7215_2452 [Pyramidobacter piscolens W5455]|uniref:Uncharacterized protein n=1 Tax=Pyramidobacter piscolens W5455 TaxID=352165 RepID=A0ABM9ZSB8_9BACT|nr:hypothetical protein HMPREF7215_2452 [Pyramidobacter piscolens W5455]
MKHGRRIRQESAAHVSCRPNAFFHSQERRPTRVMKRRFICAFADSKHFNAKLTVIIVMINIF